jgi:hypothetical protein
MARGEHSAADTERDMRGSLHASRKVTGDLDINN